MEDNKNSQPKIVETYAEDMARVISDDQGGLIKKIIEEEERKQEDKKKFDPESRTNKMYLILGVILSMIAVGVVTYFFFRKEDTTVPVEAQFTPLVFNDKSNFIEVAGLSKEKIAESVLAEARTANVKAGGVEGIYLTNNKQIVGLREFMSLLKADWQVPEETFVSDNYMIGLYNGASRDLFILIKTRSFIDIFESLRAWEGKMFLDLRGMFGIPVNADNNYLLTKDFEDGIIENKNARVLHDKAGNIVLMYVFVDENSVVVATTPDAVREAIVRLNDGKQKK